MTPVVHSILGGASALRTTSRANKLLDMVILHIMIRILPTTGPYNEHCLPVAHEREIAICTFRQGIIPPREITLFQGDGTLRGFLRAFNDSVRGRNYDVIHAQAPQTGALLIAASLIKRRSMANAVYTSQNSYQNYPLRNRLLHYPVFLLFPTIVLCSHSVLDSLPSTLRRLGRGKMFVVPNCVDTDRVNRVIGEEHSRRTNGKFTVVSVGRLIDIKNPLTLLVAFAQGRDPETRLIFVGEGDMRRELVEDVGRRQLTEHVTFTGLLEREDVYRKFAEADVYVSTSRGEGLPVAVLEAMACGTPVILSDIPPHREIATNTDFIPLIPPDDVNGFANEIRRFGRMSHDERAEVGRRCKQLAEDRFSVRSMHRAYEGIYARAMHGTRSDESRD
jgi:glycosyltransferase involved in cell wall biosynthesis